MSAIVNITNAYPPPAVTPGTVATTPTRDAASRASIADRLELSRAGTEYSRSLEFSSLSRAKIGAIRAEIEAGTYESPRRISGTVERLLDVIG